MTFTSMTSLCNAIATENGRQRPYAFEVDAVWCKLQKDGAAFFQGYTITKKLNFYTAK